MGQGRIAALFCSMKILQNNHAYIDGANLYRGAKSLGWELSYARLRTWLKEKHCVTHAYLFIGYVQSNAELYASLKNAGYTLIFKETVAISNEQIKGNCDTDLVLRAVCDTYEDEYDEAVIISSDGDYAGLVKFLKDRNRLQVVVSPSNKCSSLLKRVDIPLTYLGGARSMIEKLGQK